MKKLVLIVLLCMSPVTTLFAQRETRIIEKEPAVVERHVPEKPIREKEAPHRGGSIERENIEFKPPSPPTSKPAPLTAKVSVTTAKALARIQQLMKNSKAAKMLLMIAALEPFLEGNPYELLASGLISIFSQDWVEIANGFSSMDKVERAAIYRTVEDTWQEFATKPRLSESERKEKEFWETFYKNLPPTNKIVSTRPSIFKTLPVVEEVQQILLEYNVINENGEVALGIRPVFKVENAKHQTITVVVYFFFEDGRPLKDLNEKKSLVLWVVMFVFLKI